MKIKIFLAATVIVFFLLTQIPQFFFQKTQFIFCDVGEGDGAVLITKENVFLIDAGRDSRMVDCLTRHLPFWRREITGIIITHPDADHINGLNFVIQSYSVKWLFSNFVPNKTGEYRALYDALVNSGVIVKSFEKGEKINVVGGDLLVAPHADRPGGLSLQIESLWPLNQHHEYESTNLFSTVSVVTIGESRFLMLADSEIATQIELLPFVIPAKAGILKSDLDPGSLISKNNLVVWDDKKEESVFNPLEISKNPSENNENLTNTSENSNKKYLAVKLSHHGSSKNFSYTLLRELAPEYTVISVGKNSYGHPGKKVLEMVEKLGIKILRTDKAGDVVFECEKTCTLKQ